MLKHFMDFVDQYQGPPLGIVALGAGGSLSRLTTVPGVSRVLDHITNSWSKRSARDMLWELDTQADTFKFVSSEVVEAIIHLESRDDDDVLPVAITGALTTNRWRKGDNHAYVAIGDEFYHIRLPKLTEEEYKLKGPLSIAMIREWEDMIVTMFVLKTLMTTLDWECPDNVHVEKLP